MRKINFLYIFLIFLCACSESGTGNLSEDNFVKPYKLAYTGEPVEEVKSEYDNDDRDVVFEVDEDYKAFQTPGKSERAETQINPRHLDPKFKDNYKGKRFNYETKETKTTENRGQRIERDPLFQLTPYVIKIMMYILLIAIILAIIYYVLKNSGGFSFGKENKKISYSATAKELIEDKENIENNDFERLIQRAKAENNYKLAVRYYFLWVLQLLSDKKLINWNKDKTNFDYFNELGNQSIKDEFFSNTHIYDYIWYGEFEINKDEFKTAESIFQKTLNKLK